MDLSNAPDDNLGMAVRAGIEGQIGMLTCQVIELQARLQLAQAEINRLNANILAAAQAATSRAAAEAEETDLSAATGT